MVEALATLRMFLSLIPKDCLVWWEKSLMPKRVSRPQSLRHRNSCPRGEAQVLEAQTLLQNPILLTAPRFMEV